MADAPRIRCTFRADSGGSGEIELPEGWPVPEIGSMLVIGYTPMPEHYRVVDVWHVPFGVPARLHHVTGEVLSPVDPTPYVRVTLGHYNWRPD